MFQAGMTWKVGPPHSERGSREREERVEFGYVNWDMFAGLSVSCSYLEVC